VNKSNSKEVEDENADKILAADPERQRQFWRVLSKQIKKILCVVVDCSHLA
jgi:hypothetical protein